MGLRERDFTPLCVLCTYGRTDNKGDFNLKDQYQNTQDHVSIKYTMLNGHEPAV